jgi:prepilin-type N-terminal cleavage/methylation domain-containing protein
MRAVSTRLCARQRGFSFLEVLVALSMLLVGSVAILSLFAMGTKSLIQRKVEAQADEVRREVYVLLQDALDAEDVGNLPSKEQMTDVPLSAPDFTFTANFRPSPFGGDRAVALAVLKYRGTPVRALPPIPLTRSTLTPDPESDR